MEKRTRHAAWLGFADAPGLEGTADTIETAASLLRKATSLLKGPNPDLASRRAAAETAWMSAVALGDIAARMCGRAKEVTRHDDRAYYLGCVADRAGYEPSFLVEPFSHLKQFHADCAYQGACDEQEVRAGIALAKSLMSNFRKAAPRGSVPNVIGPFQSTKTKAWRDAAGLPRSRRR